MGKLGGIVLSLEVRKSFPAGMSHSALEVVEFVLATACRIIKLAYSSKLDRLNWAVNKAPRSLLVQPEKGSPAHRLSQSPFWRST